MKKITSITLAELKARPLNKDTVERFDRTCELWWHNIQCMRYRLYADEKGPQSCAYELVRNGNDRKPTKQLLDDARMYIEKCVYTDEEWEKWFIPAINEVLDFNNNFVRWKPGYLVRDKENGRLFIVEYDYATAFGRGCPYECTNYESLSLCSLDSKGEKITGSFAWSNYHAYELVDKNHAKENIKKIRSFLKGSNPPYCLREEILNLYY